MLKCWESEENGAWQEYMVRVCIIIIIYWWVSRGLRSMRYHIAVGIDGISDNRITNSNFLSTPVKLILIIYEAKPIF